MSPLLLLVYVDYISKLVLHGELFLFATDTTVRLMSKEEVWDDVNDRLERQ